MWEEDVLPLSAFHTDAGRCKPLPLDAAVGCLDHIDIHSAPHLPAVPGVRFLPFMCEATGDVFNSRLHIDAKKAIRRGDKGGELPPLI